MIFETTFECIALVVFIFSTCYLENNTEYFVAKSGSGSIGCLSLGLMQIASYAFKEQVRQSRELNSIIKKLRLETIPVE